MNIYRQNVQRAKPYLSNTVELLLDEVPCHSSVLHVLGIGAIGQNRDLVEAELGAEEGVDEGVTLVEVANEGLVEPPLAPERGTLSPHRLFGKRYHVDLPEALLLSQDLH